jgi:hypothetical protein
MSNLLAASLVPTRTRLKSPKMAQKLWLDKILQLALKAELIVA